MANSLYPGSETSQEQEIAALMQDKMFRNSKLKNAFMAIKEAGGLKGREGHGDYNFQQVTEKLLRFVNGKGRFRSIPSGNDEIPLRKLVSVAVETEYLPDVQANVRFLRGGNYHFTDESAGGNAGIGVWQGRQTARLASHIYLNWEGRIVDSGNKSNDQVLIDSGLTKATLFHLFPTGIDIPDPGRQVEEILFYPNSKDMKVEPEKFVNLGLSKREMILKMSVGFVNEGEANKNDTETLVPKLTAALEHENVPLSN